MQRQTQQDPSISPSTHTPPPPTCTKPTPRTTYEPDDQMSICPQSRNRLCTCQKAATEKQAGIRRTFPRTQSRRMRLPDRDVAGHPIEKGPRASEEIVGMGRKEYLMSLQEPRTSVGREGVEGVTLIGTFMEGIETSGLLQEIESQEVRGEKNEDKGDIRRVGVDGEKLVEPTAAKKLSKREWCRQKLGKIMVRTCFAAGR